MLRILCLITLVSCAGYRFKRNLNPLESYEIRSLAIPMFVNQTSLPQVSGPVTREFVRMFSSFRDLKVYAGESKSADGILIGILHSKKYTETISTQNTKFTTDDLQTSISESRNPFFVPNRSSITMHLRLILIKRPTELEMKLAKSKLNEFIIPSSKIVFNESIELSGSFARVVADTTTVDKGGVVNFTQNLGYQSATIDRMAEGAVDKFKKLILYVF